MARLVVCGRFLGVLYTWSFRLSGRAGAKGIYSG
jgi:hypothetical protein